MQSIDIVKQLGLIAVFSIINPSFANLDSLPGSSISHLELLVLQYLLLVIELSIADDRFFVCLGI